MFTGQVAVASNRADFELIQQVVDEDTGDGIDLTAATIVFNINYPDECLAIGASTDDGKITLVEDSVFRVFIPRASMVALCAGNYKAGCSIENAGVTASFIIGNVTILDGEVSR